MKRKRLLQTIALNLRMGNAARADYLKKKQIFGYIGENVRYQARLIPLYPELIKLHNNVIIAPGVRLITHDGTFMTLNRMGEKRFPERVGCIEIMDNVFVSYNTTILPNVKIGENVIIGACSTVTKDLPSGGIYAGCPAKKIGDIEDFYNRLLPDDDDQFDYPFTRHNQNITEEEITRAWAYFNKKHPEKL